MRLLIISLILRFFSLLPLEVNRYLADHLGSLLYRRNIRERKTTERNLQLCFPAMPEIERQQLVKQSMQQSTRWAFEIGAIWYRGKDWRQKKVKSYQQRELFDQAVASGRGVLLLMPHFGNWEMAGIWVSDQTKTTCIYQKPKIEELDPLVKKGRVSSEQNSLVPATIRGVMLILKALKRGELTIVLPDQVPTGEGGLMASFYGVPAYTPTLAYNLIQKVNPIVLMNYARRVPGGFEMGFMEPDPDIYSEDPQTSVEALNRSVEKICELDLTQCQWEYKRFKNQADGRDYYS